ncbi:SpoIID/LytB domain-containing protein [bacterium]|nr:SpoIID/LytB domain-containing protein [bacterium]
MLEPKPLIVRATEIDKEEIRVGVVLEEDGITTLSLTPKQRGIIRCNATSSEATLNAETTYTLKVNDRRLSLLEGGKEIFYGEGPLSALLTQNPTTQALLPSGDFTLFPIIAGRSFHWKKEITATFPGAFEFSLRHNTIEVVNILPYEHYIACVVVSEMSAGTPIEFVKTQTIAARSWACCFLNEKHPDSPYELCNDDDCQRYHGVTFADPTSLQASLETAGEYLVDEKLHVVPAYYSKSCGGITENAEDTFGFSLHGISSVVDGVPGCTVTLPLTDINEWVRRDHGSEKELYCGGPKEKLEEILGGVDDAGEYFRWVHEESAASLATYLNEKTDHTEAEKVTALIPLRRGNSGRIHELEIHYQTTAGEQKQYQARSQYEIRSLLHPSFLYSTAIEIQQDGENFTFLGAGWGHGVGLCQIGATFRALAGQGYEEILRAYFPEASLFRVPDQG